MFLWRLRDQWKAIKWNCIVYFSSDESIFCSLQGIVTYWDDVFGRVDRFLAYLIRRVSLVQFIRHHCPIHFSQGIQVIWWRNLEDWGEKFKRRIPQPRAASGVVSKLPAVFPSPKLNRSFRVYHISCYWMNVQVDPTSSYLAMLNSKISIPVLRITSPDHLVCLCVVVVFSGAVWSGSLQASSQHISWTHKFRVHTLRSRNGKGLH